MSKPQLVIQDFGGINNSDLTKTSARLQRGGSWKRHNIIMILPAADLVASKCVLSWLNLMFPPNNGVHRMVTLGQEVGEAYSTSIEYILQNPQLSNWEYVLTIEHDNAPPPDGVVRLVERMHQYPEFSAISGLYFTKGQEIPRPDGTGTSGGGVAQIWGDVNDPIPNFRPQPPRTDGGVQECYGIGMGFALWRLSMFKDERLTKPWFRTKGGINGDGIGTQDLVFAGDARKWGYRFAVDTSIHVGHYDLKGDFGPPDTMY